MGSMEASAQQQRSGRAWMKITLRSIEEQGVAQFLEGIQADLQGRPISSFTGEDGDTYRKQTGSSGHWGYRRCGTGWCRWRRRW